MPSSPEAAPAAEPVAGPSLVAPVPRPSRFLGIVPAAAPVADSSLVDSAASGRALAHPFSLDQYICAWVSTRAGLHAQVAVLEDQIRFANLRLAAVRYNESGDGANLPSESRRPE